MQNLEQFKDRGVVKFENVLSIPANDRLPGLVEKYGKEKIHGLLVIMLTEFANSFNLIRPMTPEQIVTCAFDMIETSFEDQLAVEDFALFFQGAKQAKYGKILDRMDQQVIFELFENYREQRHQRFKQIEFEKNAQFKSYGYTGRTSDEKDETIEQMRGIMCNMYKNKIMEKGEE